jgi:hypothetical protein
MAKRAKNKASKKQQRPGLVPVRTKKAGKKGLRVRVGDGLFASERGVARLVQAPYGGLLFERPRKPKGDAVQLEFSAPRRGVRPEDIGRLFAGLWGIQDELLPPNLGEGASVRPGMYVTYLSLNSPLKIDLTLIGLPEGAAEAVTQFLSDLVFRKQARRLRDAQAAEAEERVRSMKLDNGRKAFMLARDIREANMEVHQAAEELADAADFITDGPLRLKSVERPNSPAARRRRGRYGRKL